VFCDLIITTHHDSQHFHAIISPFFSLQFRAFPAAPLKNAAECDIMMEMQHDENETEAVCGQKNG